MMPRRDMKLLKDMGNKGWHVTSLRGGMFYRFEEGQPHDYDFALNHEMKVDADMLSFYEANGWTPIIVMEGFQMASGIQIFRAEAGTPPIFSDTASERHTLEMARKRTGRGALVFLVLIVAAIVVAVLTGLKTIAALVVFVIVLCLIWTGLVFTVLPYIGYSVSLSKLKTRLGTAEAVVQAPSR